MNSTELHSVDPAREAPAAVEVEQPRPDPADDERLASTTNSHTETSGRGTAALVSMRRALSRVW